MAKIVLNLLPEEYAIQRVPLSAIDFTKRNRYAKFVKKVMMWGVVYAPVIPLMFAIAAYYAFQIWKRTNYLKSGQTSPPENFGHPCQYKNYQSSQLTNWNYT